MSGLIAVICFLLGLAFVAGALEYGTAAAHFDAGTASTIHLALSVVLIFVWFHLDSRQRGYQPTIPLKLSMVGLTVVALPYYLFRSRGGRGGVKAIGAAVLTFIAAMVLYRLGAWTAS